MAVYRDEITRLATIERYLRGELTVEEEREWEEHYFQCEECFAALEETAQIRRFVKQTARGAARARSASIIPFRLPSGWFRHWLLPAPGWRQALAAAAVVIAVGIPATVGWVKVEALRHEIRELRAPSMRLATYGVEEGVRGEVPAVTIPSDVGRFLLQWNLLAHQGEGTAHFARIIDSAGFEIWAGAGLEGHGPYGTFAIVCHSSFFAEGDYVLQVEEAHTGDGEVMNRFLFPFRIGPAASVEARP